MDTQNCILNKSTIYRLSLCKGDIHSNRNTASALIERCQYNHKTHVKLNGRPFLSMVIHIFSSLYIILLTCIMNIGYGIYRYNSRHNYLVSPVAVRFVIKILKSAKNLNYTTRFGTYQNPALLVKMT